MGDEARCPLCIWVSAIPSDDVVMTRLMRREVAMSSHDVVKCQCCGKMMVPKTIFSRGIYGGWGWWIGGGRPVSSCCPFCLSESWDGSTPDVRGAIWYQTIGVLLAALCTIVVLVGLIFCIGLFEAALEVGASSWIPDVIAVVAAIVAGRRFYKWFTYIPASR